MKEFRVIRTCIAHRFTRLMCIAYIPTSLNYAAKDLQETSHHNLFRYRSNFVFYMQCTRLKRRKETLILMLHNIRGQLKDTSMLWRRCVGRITAKMTEYLNEWNRCHFRWYTLSKGSDYVIIRFFYPNYSILEPSEIFSLISSCKDFRSHNVLLSYIFVNILLRPLGLIVLF